MSTAEQALRHHQTIDEHRAFLWIVRHWAGLIAGLEKGLAIPEAFAREHARMTPSEAAARTGLTRTAARRYLLTLEHLGYLSGNGKQFGLTPRVLRVGWSYFDSARLPKVVKPYLQQLSARINESVYVSVLDEWELVFIARNSASRVMTTGFVLGARVPAPLTSAGIVLLAHWPDREEGAPLASRIRIASVHPPIP